MRLRRLGLPQSKARDLTRQIRDTIHPVAAVAVAQVQRAQSPGMSGLGFTIMSGAKMASTGASIGSAIPVIGTAIGAVVGALAAAFIHTGKKPERAARAAQTLQQLRGIPAASSGRQIEYGQSAEPTSGYILLMQALHLSSKWFSGWGTRLVDHPGNMNLLSQKFIDNSKKVMQACMSSPVGQSVSVTLDTNMAGFKNKTCNYTFINPGITTPENFATGALLPMVQAIEQSSNWPATAAADASNQDAFIVFALLADKLMADLGAQSVSQQVANNPVVNVPAPIAQQANVVANQIVQGGVAPQLVAPTNVPPISSTDGTYAQPGLVSYQNTPIPYGASSNYFPSSSYLPPTIDATAGTMQTMLSQQGVNMTSPASQQLLQDVASEGVQKTTAGVSSVPAWLLPIIAVSFAGAYIMRHK
jgi:hypothetical protein